METEFIPLVDPNPAPKEKKITRKRKPWVYLSEYERLQSKYTILSYITWAGWIAFLITLKFAV